MGLTILQRYCSVCSLLAPSTFPRLSDDFATAVRFETNIRLPSSNGLIDLDNNGWLTVSAVPFGRIVCLRPVVLLQAFGPMAWLTGAVIHPLIWSITWKAQASQLFVLYETLLLDMSLLTRKLTQSN